MNQLHNKKKRKIRFSPEDEIVYVKPRCTMNQAQRDELWYNNSEIKSFRGNARLDAESVGLPAEEHNIESIYPSFCEIHDDPNISYSRNPMEAIINSSKSSNIYRDRTNGLNRKTAVRATLEAQQQLRKIRDRNPNEFHPESAVVALASVSLKSSRWAKEAALISGLKVAYDIDRISKSAPNAKMNTMSVTIGVECIDNSITRVTNFEQETKTKTNNLKTFFARKLKSTDNLKGKLMRKMNLLKNVNDQILRI